MDHNGCAVFPDSRLSLLVGGLSTTRGIKMVKDLINVKSKVEVILREVPATRDCDKKLFLHYLARNTNIKFILGGEGWKKFCLHFMRNEIPKFESITRIRRKFQEQGFYVGKKRMERLCEAEAVKEWSKH